jgi:sialidase-1
MSPLRPLLVSVLLAAAAPAAAQAPPGPIRPSGVIVDRAPLFQWSAVPGATGYHLSVYDLTVRDYVISTVVGATSYDRPVLLDDSHAYRWRVRALFTGGATTYSAWLGFSYPLEIPPPLAPQGVIGAPATFTWGGVSGATKYQVAVYDTVAGTWLASQVVTGKTFTLGTPLDLSRTYWWKVRALNSVTSSEWSAPFTLSGVPKPIEPQGFTTTASPTLRWSRVGGATGYQVVVYDRSARAYVGNAVVSVPEYDLPTPLDMRHDYWWRVRALAGGEASAYSANVPLEVAPQAIAPRGPTCVSQPTFRWGALAQATSYELVVRDLTAGTLVFSQVVGGTQHTLPTPLDFSHRYEWTVRGLNAGGSAYAPATTFMASAPELSHQELFAITPLIGAHFRIPAIVADLTGTLVAIVERRVGGGDPGGKSDNDLVYRRSTDGGITWSPMMLLADPGPAWAASNPSAVLDRTTGRIWVAYNVWEPGHGTVSSQPNTTNNQAWIVFSDDGGETWSAPRNITAAVRDFANWGAMFFGPGGAIQTRAGRLLLPAARKAGGTSDLSGMQPYAVWSDDQGATWQRGALANALGNEGDLVETPSGVLIDVRQNAGANRFTATSADEGETWAPAATGRAVTPVDAGVERVLWPSGACPSLIVVTEPAGPGRSDLVARTSTDEGASISGATPIWTGASAYSDIVTLPDGTIGVLWERGSDVVFTRLTLATLGVTID